MLAAAQWFALIGTIVVGVAFAMELIKWRSPENLISSRHKALRVALVVLSEGLFVMMWLSASLSRKDVITELIYWTICLTLGLAVFVLAIFDLREVGKEFSARNRRAFRELLEDTQQDTK